MAAQGDPGRQTSLCATAITDVRFTPQADIAEGDWHVRFVPKDGVIGRRLVDS
jgi:hypothetical protein